MIERYFYQEDSDKSQKIVVADKMFLLCGQCHHHFKYSKILALLIIAIAIWIPTKIKATISTSSNDTVNRVIDLRPLANHNDKINKYQHQSADYIRDWLVQNEPEANLYQVESESIDATSSHDNRHNGHHQRKEHHQSSYLNQAKQASPIETNDLEDIDNDLDIIRYPCAIESSEALSAIKRARTSSCKQQLVDTACKLQFLENDHRLLNLNLRNYCINDRDFSVHRKYENLGCFKLTTEEVLEKFAFLQTKLTEMQCVDGCYKFGYEMAALENKTECFCSNHLNWLETRRSGFYHNNTSCEIDNCSKDGCIHDRALDAYATGGCIKPGFSKPKVKQLKKDDEIRIVYLLTLNGRAVRQVTRLIRNLYSKKHIFYIHVDSRADHMYRELLPLEKKYDNIILAKDRYSTIWGGSSLLRMLLHSIKQLLVSHDWDYIINLSESDFNLKPASLLEEYLANNNGVIFLKSHALDNLKFVKKQGLDKTFYECEDRMWRLGDRNLPDGVIYTGGSDWFALPREFCAYIDSDQELVAPLIELFNQTLLPAESFFHTVALNSVHCHSVLGNNLRVSNWKRKQGCKCQHKDVVDWCGCSPLVYRMKDGEKLEHIIEQDIFFSRKFDPTIDLDIINMINMEPPYPDSIGGDSALRYWENMLDFEELSVKEPNQRIQLMRNFATLAIASSGMFPDTLSSEELYKYYQLRSMDLYFHKNLFHGYLISFCFLRITEPTDECAQLYVQRERNGEHDTSSYRRDCLNNFDLKSFDVSSEFDVKERIFRNFGSILGSNSDIVLYHSWLIDRTNNKGHKQQQPATSSYETKIRYKWWNPNFTKEQILDLNLKPKGKSNSYAQALQIKLSKPMQHGQWTLKMFNESGSQCLDYKLLVFPDTAKFQISTQLVHDFKKHYHILDSCYIKKGHKRSDAIDEDKDAVQLDVVVGSYWIEQYCHMAYWSTHTKDPKSEIETPIW